MFQGKTGAAIALLDENGHSKVLNPNQHTSVDGIPTSILDVLKLKHPPAHDPHPNALDNDETRVSALDPHSVLLDHIDSGIIRGAALQTVDQPGPLAWMPDIGEDRVLALLAPLRTCVDPYHVWQGGFVLNVLIHQVLPITITTVIALDKNPDVHPVGIGETVRRIIVRQYCGLLSKIH